MGIALFCCPERYLAVRASRKVLARTPNRMRRFRVVGSNIEVRKPIVFERTDAQSRIPIF
jgi:hypothetical protein